METAKGFTGKIQQTIVLQEICLTEVQIYISARSTRVFFHNTSQDQTFHHFVEAESEPLRQKQTGWRHKWVLFCRYESISLNFDSFCKCTYLEHAIGRKRCGIQASPTLCIVDESCDQCFDLQRQITLANNFVLLRLHV